MAQFDFYVVPAGSGYWLDCQTDLMDEFNTRLVVPLLPLDTAPKPVRQLNPVLDIEGKPFVMATHYAGAIPESELGRAAGSLAHYRYEIVKAFDFLITGV